MPRSFAILRRDLANSGYTPACPGCCASAHDRKHKQHTPLCRERIAKALSEDETQAHRVLDARERKNVFLENAMREGDVSKENKVQEPMEDGQAPITPSLMATPATPRPAPHIPLSDKDERDKHLNFEAMVAGDTTNFHDAVDTDQDMYDEIEALPSDTDQMVSAIIGIVQAHVAEVWSPPIVTALANQYGLIPGSAHDIETNYDNGKTWDFDESGQRKMCISRILEQRPTFPVGSPLRTTVYIFQGLNKARMDPIKWDSMWNKGVRHMLSAIRLYRIHAESGRCFIHKHPA